MKIYSLLFSLVFSTYIFAQVGVGTTTPDASSILDITAADKGVLVPRVSLTDVTNATTPINAPATGLLIWNINATVTGGNGTGFYFFNGVQWIPIQQTMTDDADFYEVGSTTAPDDINDNMYTQGNIGIGQITADYKLDITENTALKVIDVSVTGDIDGNRLAIDNTISGTQNPGVGNQIWGIRNNIFAGGGFSIYGVENRLSGNYSSQKTGTSNVITGGTSNHYGNYNSLGGSDATSGNLRFGVYNDLNYDDPSNGEERGVYNSFQGTSTGSKSGLFNYFNHSSDAQSYGVYNSSNSLVGDGNQYGVYSTLSGTGSGSIHGGYNVFSGSNTGEIKGLYNNVLSTGGSAHYGLHNNFAGSSFDERGVYNNFQQSDSSIRYGLYNIFDSSNSLNPIDYGVFTFMTGDSSSNQYGIFQNIGNSGTGTHYGLVNQMQDGEGNKYGMVNEITIVNSVEAKGVQNILAASSSSNSLMGSHNQFTGFASEITGVNNDFDGSESLQAKGVNNDFLGTAVTTTNNYAIFSIFNNNSSGNQYGAYNEFTSTLGNIYGVSNSVSGGTQEFNGLYNLVTSTAGTGTKYGVNNFFDPSAGGTHYGIYSNVLKPGSYAGYFLGDVSIGTTTGNSYVMPDSDGTAGQVMQTDGAGNVDWVDNVNSVSSIPIYSNDSYNMNHGTGGVDLNTMDSSIEPTIYNTAGNIQIKLVIRYTNPIGTNNFQLRAHDGTTQSFPITNTSGWTFATTQNGGIATSDWVNWSAGVNAHEIHIFGWNNSNNPANDSITINNAYLLVRSQ